MDGMEQCSVAAHKQGTEPDKVVPAIKVVGNGFISLRPIRQGAMPISDSE